MSDEEAQFRFTIGSLPEGQALTGSEIEEMLLEKAIEINPERANTFKNLGLSHQALGDFPNAAKQFVAATQANAADGRSLAHLDDLLVEHPELLVDDPDLEFQLEACRKAVEQAASQQPDFNSHWNHLREAQQKKWWQFWKR